MTAKPEGHDALHSHRRTGGRAHKYQAASDAARNQHISRTTTSNDICSETSVPNHAGSTGQSYPNDYEEGGNELEDAERAHKLSQVRHELHRGREISRLGKFSNRHMSSSSSDHSCSDAHLRNQQYKNQLKSIKIGSHEQSPTSRRMNKERRNLFFNIDSSTERDNEEGE